MKVLIFSPDSFSIFRPETNFVFGGVEVETGYYANGLASINGTEVSVITRDQGESSFRKNGVSVFPHPALKGDGYWKKRASIAGRIKYRLTREKENVNAEADLIKKIDPDVIYTQGLCPEAVRLAKLSGAQKRKFVFRIASDMDLGEEKNGIVKMSWSGITLEEASEFYTNADLVMAQTPLQQELLKTRFSVQSTILYNPLNLDVFKLDRKRQKKYDVIWVGKSSTVKRPELFVELAKILPARKFLMIFNKINEQLWKEIVSGLPSNIEMIESVPEPQMRNYFLDAKLLVNTSSREGFANTFLQAAGAAVPVVSMTQDPNGMFSTHGAGRLSGDTLNELARTVDSLLQNADVYEDCARNARKYAETFHDHTKVIKRFYELISSSAR